MSVLTNFTNINQNHKGKTDDELSTGTTYVAPTLPRRERIGVGLAPDMLGTRVQHLNLKVSFLFLFFF